MTNTHNAGPEPVRRLGERLASLTPRQVGQLHLPKVTAREEEEGETSCPGGWPGADRAALSSEPKNKNAFESHRSRAESLEEGSNHKTGWSHLE